MKAHASCGPGVLGIGSKNCCTLHMGGGGALSGTAFCAKSHGVKICARKAYSAQPGVSDVEMMWPSLSPLLPQTVALT